ncbi:GDSL-like Lipase/Acylhydrolase superfamily protein [Striga asiatica]|uniref:GDSL-like Lipase/Acylhydrolase superfamily protein n=1 Tax=Striga asiatica TaxID=4170 RepID=A0A5A7Q8G9_STRAF|nr:GDSL-like Lipase/Acylhydrolase superfamily protein [Striga asiatica]
MGSPKRMADRNGDCRFSVTGLLDSRQWWTGVPWVDNRLRLWRERRLLAGFTENKSRKNRGSGYPLSREIDDDDEKTFDRVLCRRERVTCGGGLDSKRAGCEVGENYNFNMKRTYGWHEVRIFREPCWYMSWTGSTCHKRVTDAPRGRRKFRVAGKTRQRGDGGGLLERRVGDDEGDDGDDGKEMIEWW